MRLLHASTITLRSFSPNSIPPYAILSHTWGAEEDEVTLQELGQPSVLNKPGYSKIEGACRQTLKDGLEYIWIDTCCIDKTSSAELSEAINSMFRWYHDARVCYVYLTDFSTQGMASQDDLHKPFRSCKWFTRGWTLQELLAPPFVRFHSREWHILGSKTTLSDEISSITGIDTRALTGTTRLSAYSIAQRMSWASHRTTTRPEDVAYCLLGLFQINMPLLYGEGEKAFSRLQEEIIKMSDDHSIFAWETDVIEYDSAVMLGPFASSPAAFSNAADIVPLPVDHPPYFMTNKGLQIQFKSFGDSMLLDCGRTLSREPLAIVLRPIPDYGSRGYPHFRNNIYAREERRKLHTINPDERKFYRERTIFFKEPDSSIILLESWVALFDLMSEPYDYYPFNILQAFPPKRWDSTRSRFCMSGTPYRAGLLFADVNCRCWAIIVGREIWPGKEHVWCTVQRASLSVNLGRLVLDCSYQDAGMSSELEFTGSPDQRYVKVAAKVQSMRKRIIEIRVETLGSGGTAHEDPKLDDIDDLISVSAI